MIKLILLSIFFLTLVSIGNTQELSAEKLVDAIDSNLNAKSRVLKSTMIVHGRRTSRTIVSKSWVKGINQAYTEYLAPPREAGTKMLKSGDKLWTYSPQTDRVIQISGHMLRQSVMGSDMSYTDMMEDRPLVDLYNATIEGSEIIDGREHWILFLEAKITGLSYPKRRLWIDNEYLLPMKEELYANYKDELKRNSKGTEWLIEDVVFDTEIPDARFEKAILRK